MTEPVAMNETPRLIASDKVEGTRVYNKGGDRLGSIRNFMVNKFSGRVEYAVMEFGGILGIGSEYFPLPWDMLDYDEALGGYAVEIDKDKLDGAPRYRDRDPLWDERYGQAGLWLLWDALSYLLITFSTPYSKNASFAILSESYIAPVAHKVAPDAGGSYFT